MGKVYRCIVVSRRYYRPLFLSLELTLTKNTFFSFFFLSFSLFEQPLFSILKKKIDFFEKRRKKEGKKGGKAAYFVTFFNDTYRDTTIRYDISQKCIVAHPYIKFIFSLFFIFFKSFVVFRRRR